MKFEIHDKGEELINTYKPGTKVYILLGPNKYTETNVRAIHSLLQENKEVVRVYPQDVDVTNFISGSDYFSENEQSYNTEFPFWQVFLTEEEVKEAAEFVKIIKISEENWKKAIGDGTDESLAECELQSCCAIISDIRGLLHRCKKHSGLIKFDIRLLQGLCDNHECPEEINILKTILEKLEVKWGS